MLIMEKTTQQTNTYSPYHLLDFFDDVGIIMTNESQDIICYTPTAEKIIGSDLSLIKNLKSVIPINESLTSKNSSIHVANFSCTVLRSKGKDKNHEFYYIIGDSFTETVKQINSKLAEMEIIFEQSSDGIFITDGEGSVLNVNPADEKKVMMSREEMIGKNVRELVADGAFHPSAVLKTIETGTACTITQTTRNGQNVICTATPIFDESGKMTRILCNNVDYTEIVKLKENLEITEQLQKYYKSHKSPDHYCKFFTDGFLAKSKKMLEILDVIENMSEIDPTVLISGESGVGKSILAKKIHLNSPKKEGNFIEINCGAIPANLLESELFGYVKGAFTGSNPEGKVGLIELANNGTLFLDEIGDLPLELQVKFLHFLQNKKIMRLGSNREIQVNVRIISASNKDLPTLINKGLFRIDLYYRLNVVPLHIPPLRERKEEIPDLIERYLANFNEKYQLNKKMSPDTIYHLINYRWPGNIRELVNVIERLMVTSPEDIIMPSALPPEVNAIGVTFLQSADGTLPLFDALERFEKEILIQTLERSRNSYEIAEILGIGQSSVIRKLKKHGLNHLLEGRKSI